MKNVTKILTAVVLCAAVFASTNRTDALGGNPAFWPGDEANISAFPAQVNNHGFVQLTNVGGLEDDESARVPSLAMVFNHNGTAWVYLNLGQGTRTALSLDTWYHIALTRSGNIFRLFLDGTQEDSLTDSNAMTSSNAGVHNGIRLGTINSALQYPVNGYIDDVRITKGVARYTSNFTAPTTALPTSAGDVNKQIIVYGKHSKN